MIDKKIQYIDHKGVQYYFNTPPLIIPSREPDFTIKYDDKQYPHWSNKSEFFIEERVLLFEITESPGRKDIVRIMIDERYGIYADVTYRQDKSSWELQGKETHEAYVNWVISKQILE